MLIRFITISLFTAILAGSWDIWWHGAVGRDTPWEPPHLLLYAAVISAILAGVYSWHSTRKKPYKWLAIVLLAVPLSAPFDEIWHRIFGIESAISPIIIWSPPHLMLVFSLVASFAMLLPLLRREKSLTVKYFLNGLVFAGILNLLMFVVSPLEPTGPYALLGFWGVIAEAFVITLILLLSQKLFPGFPKATLVVVLFLIVASIRFDHEFSTKLLVAPHSHPENWLVIFSYLLGAVVIDIFNKMPQWVRGSLFGVLWSGLLYGFAYMFFDPVFIYSYTSGLVAIFSGLIGGLLASLAITAYERIFYRSNSLR